MSMVRIVTRIIPRDAGPESVSCLLRPDQIDIPVRTTSSSGPSVVTETTFCRAVPVPAECPDAAVASRCEGIPGLSCLKKSRLRLVTEEAGEPRLRVVPEVSADGTCTGMLLSIPLRIPRSEVPASGTTQQGNHPNVQAAFSVARTEGDFPFNGIQQQEPNQNLQTTLSSVVANGEWRNPPVSSHSEHANNSSDYTGVLQKAVEPLRGHFQGSVREKPSGNPPPPNLQHPKKNELQQFTCDQCGKKFQGKKQLVVHLRKVHEGAAGVKCPFCEARFESGKRLKGHMSVQHARQLPHECQLCGERFRTADILKNHSTQHRKEKRFRCEVCGKGFHKRVLLQGHRSSVHGDHFG